MSSLRNKIAIGLAAAALAVSAAPAYAAIYYVVFAGKPVPVDCPESPVGHDMNWVNLNCKQVQRVTGNPPTVTATPSGKLKIK